MGQRDPTGDKIRSYQRDFRNCYGHNDKASRKRIRARKAAVNRTYRRAIHEAVAASGSVEEIQERVASVVRDPWKKHMDARLGLWVQTSLEVRARVEGQDAPSLSPARHEAARRSRNTPPWGYFSEMPAPEPHQWPGFRSEFRGRTLVTWYVGFDDEPGDDAGSPSAPERTSAS